MDDRQNANEMKYCAACGKLIDKRAEICPYCGIRVMAPASGYANDAIDKHRTWIVAILLCLVLGPFGAHRFYLGKIGTGVLMLLTFGGFGIWLIVDLILLILGKFTDKDGYYVR